MSDVTEKPAPDIIALPEPRLTGEVSLEEAMGARRSRREFTTSLLSLEQVSQVVWAAQGITDHEGHRTAPSAGALCALDVYVVAGGREAGGLDAGVYHYDPERHSLEPVVAGDVRPTLVRLAVGQMFIAQAPLSLVITAEYDRLSRRYGNRAERYVHMEAGHAAQNVYLQVEALGLGTVVVGSFQDEAVSQALGLPAQHKPLYIMPVGYAV
jgi:SagB-type dehydrogenase family enzyme